MSKRTAATRFAMKSRVGEKSYGQVTAVLTSSQKSRTRFGGTNPEKRLNTTQPRGPAGVLRDADGHFMVEDPSGESFLVRASSRELSHSERVDVLVPTVPPTDD